MLLLFTDCSDFQYISSHYQNYNNTTDNCVFWCIDHYYGSWNFFHLSRLPGVPGWEDDLPPPLIPWDTGEGVSAFVTMLQQQPLCQMGSDSLLSLRCMPIMPWVLDRWLFLLRVEPPTDVLCWCLFWYLLSISGFNVVTVYTNGCWQFVLHHCNPLRHTCGRDIMPSDVCLWPAQDVLGSCFPHACRLGVP